MQQKSYGSCSSSLLGFGYQKAVMVAALPHYGADDNMFIFMNGRVIGLVALHAIVKGS
jgi:hypothetical protein